jgi:vacuolar protein sorting-associated protein 54
VLTPSATVADCLNQARLSRKIAALNRLYELAAFIEEVRRCLSTVEAWIGGPEHPIDTTEAVVRHFVRAQELLLGDCQSSENTIDSLATLNMRLSEIKKLLSIHISQVCGDVLVQMYEQKCELVSVPSVFRAAHAMGCLVPTLARHQEQLSESMWCALQASVTATCGDNHILSAQSLEALANPGASSEERIKFFDSLKPLKMSQFFEVTSAVMNDYQSAVIKVAAHWENVMEMLPAALKDGRTPSLERDELIVKVVRAAQKYTAELVDCRIRDFPGTRLTEFESIARLCFAFIHTIEDVFSTLAVRIDANKCERCFASLRSSIVQHAGVMFRRHHERLQETVLEVLRHERWGREDQIDLSYQLRCDELCRSDSQAVADFHKLSVESRRGMPRKIDDGEQRFECKLFVPNEHGRLQGYVASNSLLILIQALHEYNEFLGTYPFLAFDVIGKIYEALKVYDSQCAVYVLGALAVDQGTLVTIGVQHLAVASQCLSFLAELTPHLQRRLRAVCLSEKLSPFIDNLDRVRKEFSDHKHEFFAKIISMMRERAEMLTIDPREWDAKGNSWVVSLLKELAKLAKVLRSLMHSNDMDSVMLPLIGLFAAKIRDAIRAIPPPLISEKQLAAKIRHDVSVFKVNIANFGYDAMKCIDPDADPQDSSEELFNNYFLPPDT